MSETPEEGASFGLDRRHFLRVGGLLTAGIALADVFAAAATPDAQPLLDESLDVHTSQSRGMTQSKFTQKRLDFDAPPAEAPPSSLVEPEQTSGEDLPPGPVPDGDDFQDVVQVLLQRATARSR